MPQGTGLWVEPITWWLRRRGMWRRIGLLVGGGIAAGAVVLINVVPADEAAASGLVPFDSCADALDHLKDEAAERAGPWGLGGGGAMPLVADGAGRDMALESGDDAAAVAPNETSDAAGSSSHSTTNVQEIGVDEPDIVKTDGRLIVTTTGSTLRVVDVTGDQPREVGELSLTDEEWADSSLFLSGDRALVFVREQSMIAYDRIMPYPGMEQQTKILQVDLSDPAHPTIESTLTVDGRYIDARLVNGTARVVISSAPRLEFPTPEYGIGDNAASDEGTAPGRRPDEREMTKQNRAVIAESTIEDWLPTYTLETGGETTSEQLLSCENHHRPPDFAGFSTISVLTLGIADDGLSPGNAVGVLTDGDTVYASTDQLYVATATWGEPDEPVLKDSGATDLAQPWPAIVNTGVHAFDISGDGPARYLASGEVDGSIIGPYAMSEHEGVLRVASTIDSPRAESTESQLVTLQQEGDELVQLGQVGGLGQGEHIYSVRYFGDTGYVVTFRQVDPLYVLDLSDPAEPSVEGELKITGYSSYLHTIDDGRLLGVGQEATEEGRTVGSQVSLFDVSDPTDPQKLDGHVTENAWSDVESNPHAFLYWPETRQLVLPIFSAGASVDEAAGAETHAALVIGVGDDSLRAQGVIAHAPATEPEQPREDDEYYWSYILRSMVIGDSLYTLWNDGLQVNDLDDLDLQSWLPIESPQW